MHGVPYEVPAAAGGDEGLERFSVFAGERRAGRVAAVNDTPEGLALVVDTGDAYRAASVRFLARIDTGSRVVLLTPAAAAAIAAAPAVEPHVVRDDASSRLVRHLPRELDRFVVLGERAPSRRSSLWYVGGAGVVVGGVGLVAGPLAAAEGVGGSWRWVWVAAPLVVLVAGAWALWTAMSRDSRRQLSRREKIADAFTSSFGVSPRTRRRG